MISYTARLGPDEHVYIKIYLRYEQPVTARYILFKSPCILRGTPCLASWEIIWTFTNCSVPDISMLASLDDQNLWEFIILVSFFWAIIFFPLWLSFFLFQNFIRPTFFYLQHYGRSKFKGVQTFWDANFFEDSTFCRVQCFMDSNFGCNTLGKVKNNLG